MLMWRVGQSEVVTEPGAEPSGANSAANIGVIARNNSEGSQQANLQPFHLGGVGYQDIGVLGLGSRATRAIAAAGCPTV
jgi:hypothetical protein